MKTKHTVEAYGVKGLKSISWRKTFKDVKAMNDWVEKNDAQVHGFRELEPQINITETNLSISD